MHPRTQKICGIFLCCYNLMVLETNHCLHLHKQTIVPSRHLEGFGLYNIKQINLPDYPLKLSIKLASSLCFSLIFARPVRLFHNLLLLQLKVPLKIHPHLLQLQQLLQETNRKPTIEVNRPSKRVRRR